MYIIPGTRYVNIYIYTYIPFRRGLFACTVRVHPSQGCSSKYGLDILPTYILLTNNGHLRRVGGGRAGWRASARRGDSSWNSHETLTGATKKLMTPYTDATHPCHRRSIPWLSKAAGIEGI